MDNMCALYIDNNRTSPDYLTVNSCGICTDETHGYGCVSRPNGRLDYQLSLLIRGEYLIDVDGKELAMHAGQLLLFLPGQPQSYRPKPNVPYEWRWIHFSGTACPELLSQLQLADRIPIQLKNTLEVDSLTTDMVREFVQKKAYYEHIMNGQFLTLLGAIARIIWAPEAPGRGSWLPLLEDSRKQIYWCFAETLQIEQLAKLCNLSPSRYLYLFKRQYGISPHRYQVMLRIEKAKILLQSTDLSVRQVGEKVGYSDYAYFSRVFKQHTGCVPTQYRK